MPDVNFIKAIALAKQGIRKHLEKRWEEEEACKEAIMQFTRNPEEWIKEVNAENLLSFQYLYIVWKSAGRTICSVEEYDELFYSEEFEKYYLKNSDYSFEKLLLEYSLEGVENYFLDIELDGIVSV